LTDRACRLLQPIRRLGSSGSTSPSASATRRCWKVRYACLSTRTGLCLSFSPLRCVCLSPLAPKGRGVGGEGGELSRTRPLSPDPSPPRGEGSKGLTNRGRVLSGHHRDSSLKRQRRSFPSLALQAAILT